MDITDHVANAKNNHHNHHEYINSSLGHKVLTNDYINDLLQNCRIDKAIPVTELQVANCYGVLLGICSCFWG